MIPRKPSKLPNIANKIPINDIVWLWLLFSPVWGNSGELTAPLLTLDPVLVDVLITPLLVALLGWEGFPGWLELGFPLSVPLPGLSLERTEIVASLVTVLPSASVVV